MILVLYSFLFDLGIFILGVGFTLLCLFLFYRIRRPIEKHDNKEQAADDVEEPVFSEQERIRNEKIGSALNTLMQEEKLYLSPNLTISDLSRAVGTNNAYMSAYLNNVKRQNFSTYINSFRLECAVQLLISDPTISIEDVCNNSGFNSLPSFQRIFHNKYGCSPGQYRHQKIIDRNNVDAITDVSSGNKSDNAEVFNTEKLTSVSSEKNFISAFETSYPGKIEALCKRFPTITHKEKILCMLIIKGKTPDEVCKMMDITPGSLNVFRSRLRKKFNLSQKEPLNRFLKAI